MEIVEDRNEMKDLEIQKQIYGSRSRGGVGANDGVGANNFHLCMPGGQPDVDEIKKRIATKGSLSFGATKMPSMSLNVQERMPLQTLQMGRRRKIVEEEEVEDLDDVELGESSQLQFDKVLRMWQEKKKAQKGGGFSLFRLGSHGKKSNTPKKRKGKLMMWETFLESERVTESNPAWRHASQTYTSAKFKEKCEFLFTSIDTNGVGFLEKHEFMFMLDGLRGRMHHFLRNTRQMYFTQGQDEMIPADQEFVLSDDFKNSLVTAIQDRLYTWRMTEHAWAVGKDLFENLMTLIFCSTVNLIMTDEGKNPVDVPVAIEFYLLMSPEGIAKPVDSEFMSRSSKDTKSKASSSSSIDDLASSLFCKAIFDLHMICPPQSCTYVDETLLECSAEMEQGLE